MSDAVFRAVMKTELACSALSLSLFKAAIGDVNFI